MLRKSIFKSRGRIAKTFSKVNERREGGVQITHQKINRRGGDENKVWEVTFFKKYSPVYMAVMSIPMNTD